MSGRTTFEPQQAAQAAQLPAEPQQAAQLPAEPQQAAQLPAEPQQAAQAAQLPAEPQQAAQAAQLPAEPQSPGEVSAVLLNAQQLSAQQLPAQLLNTQQLSAQQPGAREPGDRSPESSSSSSSSSPLSSLLLQPSLVKPVRRSARARHPVTRKFVDPSPRAHQPVKRDPNPLVFSLFDKSYKAGGLQKLQFRQADVERDGKTVRVLSPGQDPLVRALCEEQKIPRIRFREPVISGLSDKITEPRTPTRSRRKNNSKGRKGAKVIR